MNRQSFVFVILPDYHAAFRRMSLKTSDRTGWRRQFKMIDFRCTWRWLLGWLDPTCINSELYLNLRIRYIMHFYRNSGERLILANHHWGNFISYTVIKSDVRDKIKFLPGYFWANSVTSCTPSSYYWQLALIFYHRNWEYCSGFLPSTASDFGVPDVDHAIKPGVEESSLLGDLSV